MVHFPCFVSLPACKWFGSFCWPFLTSWKTLVRNSSGSIGRQQNNSWKWQQAGWAFQIASIFTVFCVFYLRHAESHKFLQQNNVKQKQLTYSKKVFIMETWGESIWKAFQPIFWTFHHFCPTNKKTKMASRFHLSHKCQANPVVFELTSENSLLAFPLCLLFLINQPPHKPNNKYFVYFFFLGGGGTRCELTYLAN